METIFFCSNRHFFDPAPLHMTCVFRRDAAIREGCYREDILSTDFESFYRLMLGHKVGFVNEVAGLWRQHDRNISKTCSYRSYADNFRTFMGPYEKASSLGVFTPQELKTWLRQGAGRYFAFCLQRMLASGRILDALRLTRYVLALDGGIVRHSLDRAVRRMLRSLYLVLRPPLHVRTQ